MNESEESGSITPGEDVQRIVESARRLGVEMDENEAVQWLTAVAAGRERAGDSGGDVVVDTHSGVFGHRVTMLDFSPLDLRRFREIGELVAIGERPGVESALALSGSAAQSKIQTCPGDCDYFERVNIHAPTRRDACRVLGNLVREKALATLRGPTYRLTKIIFGTLPFPVVKGGQRWKAGWGFWWSPAEAQAGQFEARREDDGSPITVRWDDVAADPGWCKLDWVVVDPVRDCLAAASSVIDGTWEAPDGTITPLDGYLDPYFQEVYLEAESVPLFSKLIRNVTGDALEEYVTLLEREVRKFVTRTPNYGKAAKRMYNIFRLTGRYEEAAYLRELFDEPANVLYQVYGLIHTLDAAGDADSQIPVARVVADADRLAVSVAEALPPERADEIVRHLENLRDSLVARASRSVRDEQVKTAQAEVLDDVNRFFLERLVALPGIEAYMAGLQP